MVGTEDRDDDDILTVLIACGVPFPRKGLPFKPEITYQFGADYGFSEDTLCFLPWFSRMRDYKRIWERIKLLWSTGKLKPSKSRRRKVTFLVTDDAKPEFAKIIERRLSEMASLPACSEDDLKKRVSEISESYSKFRTEVALAYWDDRTHRNSC